MSKRLKRSEEKKVEYLELIYDLIFVYIIGRNNSLLHELENGFVSGRTFLAFVLCSFAIIQIWNYSTFYINLFGRNGVRDHVSLFLNMYLLYYIGEGTRLHWESFQNQYHFAWGLILVNIGVQYALELRNHPDEPQVRKTIRSMMLVLFLQAAIVFAAIPVFNRSGVILAPVAILFGVAATWAFNWGKKRLTVDFSHLSERAMLYVVFTFGEMIIAIASYFAGDLTARSVYFSTMSFLIVVGLFLCYGLLYDRILDRTKQTDGLAYMLVHIFLIFALNCITASLEFMRSEDVRLLPKTLMLIGSFLLFFFCLFALQGYARPQLRLCPRFLVPVAGLTAAFCALMLLLREKMIWNVLVTVVYVFAVFLLMYRFSKHAAPSADDAQPERGCFS